ncbi:MAG: hypothetical protein LAT64_07310 [Phycisphaerales bacterium]|nr:hypothetical protein [Planctomycetota bacterium]MCH8508564.1 hypothetical protein [Phycisphaerales bacterium]
MPMEIPRIRMGITDGLRIILTIRTRESPATGATVGGTETEETAEPVAKPGTETVAKAAAAVRMEEAGGMVAMLGPVERAETVGSGSMVAEMGVKGATQAGMEMPVKAARVVTARTDREEMAARVGPRSVMEMVAKAVTVAILRTATVVAEVTAESLPAMGTAVQAVVAGTPRMAMAAEAATEVTRAVTGMAELVGVVENPRMAKAAMLEMEETASTAVTAGAEGTVATREAMAETVGMAGCRMEKQGKAGVRVKGQMAMAMQDPMAWFSVLPG